MFRICEETRISRFRNSREMVEPITSTAVIHQGVAMMV
jgi:hypothetical protein